MTQADSSIGRRAAVVAAFTAAAVILGSLPAGAQGVRSAAVSGSGCGVRETSARERMLSAAAPRPWIISITARASCGGAPAVRTGWPW